MATSTSGENVPKSSGESTEQYKRVNANFDSIVKSLKANTDAFSSLRCKLKEKNWCQLDVTPQRLLEVVLDRIRLNAKVYDEFIEVLDNVDGLDLIKDTIEGTKLPVQETSQKRALPSSSVEPESHPAAGCDDGADRQDPRDLGGSGRERMKSKKEPGYEDGVATDSGVDNLSDNNSDTRVRSRRHTKKQPVAAQVKPAPLCIQKETQVETQPAHVPLDNVPTGELVSLEVSDAQSASQKGSNTPSKMVSGSGEIYHQYSELAIKQMEKFGENDVKQAQNGLTKMKDLEATVADLETKLTELKLELTEKNAKLKQYEENNTDMQEKYRLEKEKVENLTSQIASMRDEIKGLKSQMDQQKAEREKEFEKLRQEFDKLQLRCEKQVRDQLQEAREERDRERARAEKERARAEEVSERTAQQLEKMHKDHSDQMKMLMEILNKKLPSLS